MAPKRMISEERGQGSEEMDFLQVSSKRRQEEEDNPAGLENAKICSISLFTVTTNDIALYVEPVIRKVVQEMIPPMLQRCLTNNNSRGLTPNQQLAKALANTSGGGSRRRHLQLCFINQLPPTIYTRSNLKAKGGEPLQFELRDAAAHQQRIVGGGYSLLRIRVCVLKGEFGSNGDEDWTTDEFNSQTATPQKGKGSLLNRDPFIITLKNGVGYIEEDKIFFTDISRTPSKKFRLGLQVIDQPNNYIIREGRSEPFRVMDQRGKGHVKYDCPPLNAEVWRLRGIHKGGKLYEQLTKHGIETVKHLLQLYITNQASLKQILGKTVAWNTITALARDCDVNDDERYIYHATEQSMSLVFNCIYEVLEVTFDRQNYHSIKSLNLREQRLVEGVKQQAYNNLKNLKPLEPTKHGLGMTTTYVQNGNLDQQFDLPNAQQDQPEAEACQSNETVQPWLTGGELVSEEELSEIDLLARHLFSPDPLEQVSFLYPLTLGCGDGGECSNNNNNLPLPSRGKCSSSSSISRNGKGNKTVWHKIRTAFKCVATFCSSLTIKPCLI